MLDTFATFLLQALSVIDSFSVALIVGTLTVLVVLEVSRHKNQELDRGTKVTRAILGYAILAQLVYRGIDLFTTFNLIANGDVTMTDISPAYIISLILTLAAVIAFALQKAHKINFQMFVFLEGALWYTGFALSQFAAQSSLVASLNAAVLSLTVLVVVILVLLVLDSSKRYYHKNCIKKSK